MVTSYSRGWKIKWENGWKYMDGETIKKNRPCKRCGKMPISNNEDACIGHIDGAISACCGHGVGHTFVLWENGILFHSLHIYTPTKMKGK